MAVGRSEGLLPLDSRARARRAAPTDVTQRAVAANLNPQWSWSTSPHQSHTLLHCWEVYYYPINACPFMRRNYLCLTFGWTSLIANLI